MLFCSCLQPLIIINSLLLFIELHLDHLNCDNRPVFLHCYQTLRACTIIVCSSTSLYIHVICYQTLMTKAMCCVLWWFNGVVVETAVVLLELELGFNVHIRSKLLQHTFVVGASSEF